MKKKQTDDFVLRLHGAAIRIRDERSGLEIVKEFPDRAAALAWAWSKTERFVRAATLDVAAGTVAAAIAGLDAKGELRIVFSRAGTDDLREDEDRARLDDERREQERRTL